MRKQPLKSRRKFTNEEKLSVLKEHTDKGIPIAVLARLHAIHPVTLYQWKRCMNKQNEFSQPRSDLELINELEKLRNENKALKNALSEALLDKQALEDINFILKKKKIEAKSTLPKKHQKLATLRR